MALTTLLSCAGENKAAKPPVVNFEKAKYTCLLNADETLDLFFQGSLPNEEITVFWNCLDIAVRQFVSLTEGKNGKNYTADEIAGFLDRFFLENWGLRSEKMLLVRVMEVKQLFIGGSVQSVSYEDLFTKARALIQTFKQITLDLNPHMRTIHDGFLNGRSVTNFKDEQVAAAEAAIKQALTKIGQVVQPDSRFYSFSQAADFLANLEKFMKKKRPEFSFDLAIKVMPLLGEIKGLLVKPPYDLIKREEWTDLLALVGDFLGAVLRYRHFIQDQDWDRAPALAQLEYISDLAMSALERGLKFQPQNTYHYLDLDRLMGVLDDLNWLPLDINKKTAQNALRVLGHKVLAHGGADGLNKEDLTHLNKEVVRWLEVQQFINKFIEQGATPKTNSEQEMKLIMDAPWSLRVDQDGRLQFSGGNIPYDRSSLTRLNWQRALIRALMRGYHREEQSENVVGLTQDEFTVLAQDWESLAEAIGLFQTGGAARYAKKIFMEANLFMPSSNGDNLIDFTEATQYLAYGVSGLSVSSMVEETILPLCASPQAPHKYLAECLRQQLFANIDKLFSHLPMLQNYINRNPQTWSALFEKVEITGRGSVKQDDFSRGDIVEAFVLLQYIETFFLSYDDDHTQTISVPESLAAFPTFEYYLGQIVSDGFGLDMEQSELTALFTFLFKYGKPPQSTFSGLLRFINWRLSSCRWQYEADRLRVAEILSELNKLK